MNLTSIKAELAINKDYAGLSQKAWEQKIAVRTIDYKFDDVIENLIPMYVKKISGIRYDLQNGSDFKVVAVDKDGKRKSDAEIFDELMSQLDNVNFQTEKLARLTDKLACCLKEQELRAAKLVARTPHHTTYYIDYTNGNDSNDGLSADNSHSWKTINKYTTTTVRTAGDIAYVRANQTHDCSGATIACDEDGTVDAYISVIGCDATTNDPWSDDSNTKTIIDFGNASYALEVKGDKYWWFENLIFTKSNAGNGPVQVEGSSSALALAYFKLCEMTNGNASTIEGFYLNGYCIATLDSCIIYDANGTAINNTSGILYMYNCTLNAGASKPSAYCIVSTGYVYAYGCSFGVTTNYTTAICLASAGEINLVNCTYGGTLYITNESRVGILRVEDNGGTYGSHLSMTTQGEISRQTASPRDGGSASYAKMTSFEECGPNNMLRLGTKSYGFSPKWLTKDIEYTITVYARVGSAWDSALSASEAFLKVSYLSNASTAARTEVQSTETIANDTTWTAFTVTFTPLQTGFAYIWFYLAEYEDASEYIDVDIEPVVS